MSIIIINNKLIVIFIIKYIKYAITTQIYINNMYWDTYTYFKLSIGLYINKYDNITLIGIMNKIFIL